jgi:DNA gyrase subunit A
VYWLKVYQLPDVGRSGKGKAIVNLLSMSQGERVTATLPVRVFAEDQYVVMATQKGYIKKTDLAAFSHPRQGGLLP